MTAPVRLTDAASVLAVIEDHLSTGLGCRCGQWRLDTSQRPVDPRAQHRAHVADILADRLPEATTVTEWGVRWVEVEGRAREVGQVESSGTLPDGTVGRFTEHIARYTAGTRQQVVRRTVTRYADQYGPWEQVTQ